LYVSHYTTVSVFCCILSLLLGAAGPICEKAVNLEAAFGAHRSEPRPIALLNPEGT